MFFLGSPTDAHLSFCARFACCTDRTVEPGEIWRGEVSGKEREAAGCRAVSEHTTA
jgi:hypothetical protein